jgi:hypothetical protein
MSKRDFYPMFMTA